LNKSSDAKQTHLDSKHSTAVSHPSFLFLCRLIIWKRWWSKNGSGVLDLGDFCDKRTVFRSLC